jgi:hypothetical protein
MTSLTSLVNFGVGSAPLLTSIENTIEPAINERFSNEIPLCDR